jgi:hypothetical protein
LSASSPRPPAVSGSASGPSPTRRAAASGPRARRSRALFIAPPPPVPRRPATLSTLRRRAPNPNLAAPSRAPPPLPRSAPPIRAVAASPSNWSRPGASHLGEEHTGAAGLGPVRRSTLPRRRRPCAAAMPCRAPSSFCVAAREGLQWVRARALFVSVQIPQRLVHPSAVSG